MAAILLVWIDSEYASYLIGQGLAANILQRATVSGFERAQDTINGLSAFLQEVDRGKGAEDSISGISLDSFQTKVDCWFGFQLA